MNYNKNSLEKSNQNNDGNILLVTYDSSSLKYNDKIKFYYALKGRDGISGIMKLYNINFLSKKVFLLNPKFLNDIKLFFNQWKLSFTISEIKIISKETNEVKKFE